MTKLLKVAMIDGAEAVVFHCFGMRNGRDGESEPVAYIEHADGVLEAAVLTRLRFVYEWVVSHPRELVILTNNTIS